MRALKRWLDRSLTAQAVLIFLLVMGIGALFGRYEHPVLWVIQGAVYTAIGTAFAARRRRRVGRTLGIGQDEIADLNRKIRHREVPREPEEQATMRRLVTEYLKKAEWAGRWLPYWLGFMGLLAAGMLALGAAKGSLVLPLVFALLVLVCSFVALWARRRAMDHWRYMSSALQSHGRRAA